MRMNVLLLDFKLPKGKDLICLTSFAVDVSEQCLTHKNIYAWVWVYVMIPPDFPTGGPQRISLLTMGTHLITWVL